jgi:gamma-F420-2:alpha-L-glutamate ligase
MELIHETRGVTNLILQEFIEPSRGRDLRVFVLGGRPIACVERTSSDGGFKANHSRGGKVVPFELTPEIEWMATETARILELEIAGVDLLFDGDNFRVCEANSAPGFCSIEECTDVDVSSLIFRYLRVRLGMMD